MCGEAWSIALKLGRASMKREQPRHRVVIVGAGFGGLEAARHLGRRDVDVVVIDRHNHHLFQPLLYQVAGGALDISQIAWPIRELLHRWEQVSTLMAEVSGVDTQRKAVSLVGGGEVGYDTLILATGATHAYFGHDQWARFAPGLKTLGDAIAIRQHVLTLFEQAELEDDLQRRETLMTIVVVGAGPTGVELACTIAELAHDDMVEDFRNADTRKTRVILVEASNRVLASFPPSLGAYALREMERLGVTVLLNHPVTDCRADGVACNDRFINAGAVFWAAGVRASPPAQWLHVDADRVGRVRVNTDLSVPGRPDIFVIGDAALCEQTNGDAVPGLAPAAKQEGAYVAKVILARLHGNTSPRPFRYRNYGNLATVGKGVAVVDFGSVHLRGRLAWMMWAVAHIYFLIGTRNRLLVALNWLWLYLKNERAARIILDTPQDK
jgi:NADH:ubiquinone reductase (H+-translocating)